MPKFKFKAKIKLDRKTYKRIKEYLAERGTTFEDALDELFNEAMSFLMAESLGIAQEADVEEAQEKKSEKKKAEKKVEKAAKPEKAEKPQKPEAKPEEKPAEKAAEKPA